MFSLKSRVKDGTVNQMVTAAATGAVVAQVCISWLGLCGNSPLSVTALMVGLTTAAILANWAAEFLPRRRNRSGRNWPAVGPAVVVVMLSWMTPQLLNATLLAGCETIGMGGSMRTLLTLLFPALIVATVCGVASLYFQSAVADAKRTWTDSILAGGVGVMGMTLHSWINWPLAVSATAAVLTSLGCVLFLRPACHDTLRETSTASGSSTIPQSGLILLHFAAAGLLFVSVTEIISRILSITVPVLTLSIGFASIGLMALSSATGTRLLKVGGLNAVSLLVLAFFPVMFSMLASLNLWINASCGVAFVVIALRAMQYSVLVIAVTLPAVLASKHRAGLTAGRAELLSGTAGIVLGFAAVGHGISPVLLLGIGIAIHAFAAFLANFTHEASSIGKVASGSRIAWRASALMMLIPLVTGFANFDPVRTASLIFSPRTIVAIQRGVAEDLIPQSDANRLVVTTAGDRGELSVWRRAGNVVEFQRNGISLGQVSTDTRFSPQPVEEVLPAIMAFVSHPKPARLLILGDDTGACLRSCSHFPVQDIVAVRSDERLTELVRRFTWSDPETPTDQDPRVTILHAPEMIALRNRELKLFDVVVASSESAATLSGSSQFTTEYYDAARSRMTSEGVFCQRFRQHGMGPEPVKATMATMLNVFSHVGAVQAIPGEILLFATNSEAGLIDPAILARLQRDHVRQEIASAGWDWSQVAVLPLVDATDPIGMFSHEDPPKAISIGNGGFVMSLPFETARKAFKSEETRMAFAPHQMQLLAATPTSEDHMEVSRRLSALTQQMEILAGMPDQPWTYRKSLRMELQRSPRPPQEIIDDGHVVKTAHPVDVFCREYFVSLGKALSAVTKAQPANRMIESMERFTDNPEPLLSHFAHYEIVRLHELAKHPSPADEFRHRLHIVFFTSASDASVRPVISSIEQLVAQPDLVPDAADRYDMLNALLQKLIERWEARTAWEPRSAQRVQNDVDQSVRITNLALDLMETAAEAAQVDEPIFLRRRRYINAALIAPLRQYRDQVLAHRMKKKVPTEPDSEDPNDMPLLLNSSDMLNTN